ncbi:MAG: PqqD family protein [Lachnospiraceae bacterium]
MRAAKEMMLREIAGEHILIPTGSIAVKFNGLINLNQSGLLLWNKLQKDCTKEDLVNALLEEYEVDSETAEADVEKFLNKMREAEILLESD